MGKKKGTGVATPVADGKYLLASHIGEGFRAYRGRVEGEIEEIVLKPGIETVIVEAWQNVPDFARDVQAEIVVLRRSDRVPPSEAPDVLDELVQGLPATQINIARTIVRSPELT